MSAKPALRRHQSRPRPQTTLTFSKLNDRMRRAVAISGCIILLAGCSRGASAPVDESRGVSTEAMASTTSEFPAFEPGISDNDVSARGSIDFFGDYAITDETFGTSVRVTVLDGLRTIQTNALPDHETGDFPNDGNPNSIAEQDRTWVFPAVPTYSETMSIVQVPGVAVNGVKFEPGTAETVVCSTGEVYRVDGLQPTINLGMDMNNAHVQPTGEYHYHGVADALIERYADGQDVVFVGFAADGHFIYHSVSNAWRSGYVLRTEPRTGSSCALSLPSGETMDLDGSMPDGTFVDDWVWERGSGSLDECNGTFVNGEYAYVLTDEFPFIPRCLHGELDAGFEGTEVDGATRVGSIGPPPGNAGPQSPPCGEFDLDVIEVVGGVTFEPGRYVVHAFGIECDDVLGDGGVLEVFLALGHSDPLPEPWRFLDDAIGAPKFVAGPQQGFRVQRLPSG